MSVITDLIGLGTKIEGHGPWCRVVVDAGVWQGAVEDLASGAISLLSLWGESGWVHMALLSEDFSETAILSLACPNALCPSVARRHTPAIRLERTLSDLVGLEADGAKDTRPWLDHGRWSVRHPDGAAGAATTSVPYAFLPAEGESLHQIAVGPVHAGIIEPGHFRFTANGETLVRLEARLGYLHRGLEGQMAGAKLERAAQLAARASGDSTVAYSIAFARAVEAALGFEAPPRAAWLRALMAEMERLANHLGDIGGICNDAAFVMMLAHCGVLREEVLRTARTVFGHRLMMDRVVPGGVAVDLDKEGKRLVGELIASVRQRFLAVTELYDETPSLQDRTVSTGVVTAALVRQFAAGGYVGRASGRAFDARRAFLYAPYDRLALKVPIRQEGDVNARVWIRIDEVAESLSLIEQILHGLPAGPVHQALPPGSGEGVALVEGFRGDVLAWVRIRDGVVDRAHLRDPSWFQWPLLEACVEGNIVADFPLCNKSFNCSYAGCDL
jgi:Ni,Fe-hydrogenase III large subunit